MELYFSPEWMNGQSQILNVVDQKQKAVGFLCILKEDKKMYVFGNLQEIGVKEDFKDLVQPYVAGMTKMNKEVEVFSYLTAGGEKIDFKEENQEEKPSE